MPFRSDDDVTNDVLLPRTMDARNTNSQRKSGYRPPCATSAFQRPTDGIRTKTRRPQICRTDRLSPSRENNVYLPDARENGLSGNTRESVWNKFVGKKKNRKKFINVVRNVWYLKVTCLYVCIIYLRISKSSHGRFCKGGATIRLLRAFRSRLARRDCIKLHVTQWRDEFCR